PEAAIIQFLGGMHGIYFRYGLCKRILLLAVMVGGVSGVFTFALFGARTARTVSPGCIIILCGLVLKGLRLGVIAGVFVAAAVSCIVASLIVKTSKQEGENLSEATDKMEEMKGKKSSVAGTLHSDDETAGETEAKSESEQAVAEKQAGDVHKIIFACDAGMGSSAMGASLMKDKLKKADLDIYSTNKAINDIPDDADIIITHKNLTNRTKDNLST